MERFDFAWAPAYQAAALGFGITPAFAWVIVDGERLKIRFGPWRVVSARSNLAGVRVTGPYALLKTIGPPHLGWSDRSLSFSSNGQRGVELAFREPVGGIEPSRRLKHPLLTVTVTDVDGLAALLRNP